jgi:hypothetical protein
MSLYSTSIKSEKSVRDGVSFLVDKKCLDDPGNSGISFFLKKERKMQNEIDDIYI